MMVSWYSNTQYIARQSSTVHHDICVTEEKNTTKYLTTFLNPKLFAQYSYYGYLTSFLTDFVNIRHSSNVIKQITSIHIIVRKITCNNSKVCFIFLYFLLFSVKTHVSVMLSLSPGFCISPLYPFCHSLQHKTLISNNSSHLQLTFLGFVLHLQMGAWSHHCFHKS